MMLMRNDNVLVEILRDPSQTESGLVLPQIRPESQRQEPMRARVLAVGPGHRLRGGRGPLQPTEVAVGDVVLVEPLAGQRAQDWSMDADADLRGNSGCDWGDRRIVRHDELLAVVT